MKPETPYYLMDERKLLRNLKIIEQVRNDSGAKSVLALKCFAAWAVFPLLRDYMDGTTASSPYEARLGKEKFGKEVHVYSPGYSDADIREISAYADTIIFNSVSQLRRFHPRVRGRQIGLRVNPGRSYSHYDLADPARRFSRLGVVDKPSLRKALPLINGAMFHFNCDNADFNNFSKNLDYISRKYGSILRQLEWVSLGGGLYFTKVGYPVQSFCQSCFTCTAWTDNSNQRFEFSRGSLIRCTNRYHAVDGLVARVRSALRWCPRQLASHCQTDAFWTGGRDEQE